MRNLRRHTNALAQRGVRVNRLANVHGVGAHRDGRAYAANRKRLVCRWPAFTLQKKKLLAHYL